MNMERYLALFEPDRKAGGYVVTFPDFGYGVTQGETDKEAMEMAQDLLMLTIRDFIRESSPLPKAKRHRGSRLRPVELPALQAAKVDLYTGFLVSGLQKAELARRIGIPLPIESDRSSVRRARQAATRRSAQRSLKFWPEIQALRACQRRFSASCTFPAIRLRSVYWCSPGRLESRERRESK
jgi:antitoxin HicB